MASASTPSANESVKDLILVHTIQLKPIKASFSGRMVSSGDVVIASVHSEKTRLKKFMKIIIIIIIITIIMNKLQETTILACARN